MGGKAAATSAAKLSDDGDEDDGGMDDIDEDELEAELEGLEDELEDLDMDEEATPSYLEGDALPQVPTAIGEAGGSGGGGGGGSGKVAVDEMGLPAVPAN